MKRLTKKPWFEPRYLGWGWRPITWEGWLLSLVFFGAIYSTSKYLDENLYIIIGITLIFCIFAYLTGGKPGSKLLDRSK